MTNPNDRINPIPDYKDIYKEGLTKREYFAAMAMQGILAQGKNNHYTVQLAADAVIIANALVEALNNKDNPNLQP